MLNSKQDLETLMLKSAEDATKAHAYAIEANGILRDYKHKIEELEILTEALISLEKTHKEF